MSMSLQSYISMPVGGSRGMIGSFQPWLPVVPACWSAHPCVISPFASGLNLVIYKLNMAEVSGCEVSRPRLGRVKVGYHTGCTLSYSFMDGSSRTKPVARSRSRPVERHMGWGPKACSWPNHHVRVLGSSLYEPRVSIKTEPIGWGGGVYVQRDLFYEIGACDYGGWEASKSVISRLETPGRQWCSSSPSLEVWEPGEQLMSSSGPKTGRRANVSVQV